MGISKEQFYQEIINCMLRQEIIPQSVLFNWNRPRYYRGYENNFDFEILEFLKYIDRLNINYSKNVQITSQGGPQ